MVSFLLQREYFLDVVKVTDNILKMFSFFYFKVVFFVFLLLLLLFCCCFLLGSQRLTLQSHIRRVHACLAVICHLHFWQNDWDLLRAAAVTPGWNGY